MGELSTSPAAAATPGTTEVHTELLGAGRKKLGGITLNRPSALNALNLSMVRSLRDALSAWAQDEQVLGVVIRGSSKVPTAEHFGHFCAGGDIRFFHQAALAGDPRLEDFFTEEYALNHAIHQFAKPYICLADGVVMGGGMGIAGHGAQAGGQRLRIVTERTKMAMPEAGIGLFPDVGGGYFLSQLGANNGGTATIASCTGEYLALTGQVLEAADALSLGLADAQIPARELGALWAGLGTTGWTDSASVMAYFERALALGGGTADPVNAADPKNAAINSKLIAQKHHPCWTNGQFDQISGVFDLPTALDIVRALEARTDNPWAQATAATLRSRSPLMLEVSLAQIRACRGQTLGTVLRMERDMVRHCFHTQHLGRSGRSSETVEGIRALAVDKDHQPVWSPARLEDVTPAMVAGFFNSPWGAPEHPLASLA